MRIFIGGIGLLALAMALGLLAAPAAFYAPAGIAMTPIMATVAQAHGATLAGLGLATFLTAWSRVENVRPVLIGNLVMQMASLLVAVRTVQLNPDAVMTPALAIHSLLSAALALAIWRTRSVAQAA